MSDFWIMRKRGHKMRMRSITLAVCIVAMLAGSMQGLAQTPQQEHRREALQTVLTVGGPQVSITTQAGPDAGYVFRRFGDEL
jgi:hypothetical protein